jgi:hypothetical protein
MRYTVLTVKWLKVAGMAVYPFILINDNRLRHDQLLLRHEEIHLRQQVELLILPFYLLYLINYLINRIRYKDHDTAYRHIVFEKEAYDFEADTHYLKRRRFLAWRRYV